MAHYAVSNPEMCPPKADSERLKETRGCAEAYWTYAAQANPQQFDTEIGKRPFMDGHELKKTIQSVGGRR